MATFEEVQAAQEKFCQSRRYRKYANAIGGNKEDGFYLVVFLEKPQCKQQWFPPTYAGVPLVVEVIGKIELQGGA